MEIKITDQHKSVLFIIWYMEAYTMEKSIQL